MVKTDVIIKAHKNKTGASGKDYTSFLCEFNNNGGEQWMNAFDSEVIDPLRAVEGKNEFITIEVREVKIDGKSFWNIRSVENGVDIVALNSNETSPLDTIPKEKPLMRPQVKEIIYPNPIRKSVKGSAYEKDPVGLAIEVYIAIITSEKYNRDKTDKEEMSTAVDLVKLAQNAFS